jgi:hypothetical protein
MWWVLGWFFFTVWRDTGSSSDLVVSLDVNLFMQVWNCLYTMWKACVFQQYFVFDMLCIFSKTWFYVFLVWNENRHYNLGGKKHFYVWFGKLLHQRSQRYVVEGRILMVSCAWAAVMKICCSIVWIVTGNYDIHCSQILSCGDENVIEFSCNLT